ncbi:alpha-1,4-N-acetylglucosaminyltransferase-like isoform X2 [Plodia interpunctella]|uniref:alpha-1,4-N-acetylglucosaminyltransferase-like isoform X2 n=1 Tax=Plodia interpunctella TaxID=58824 RepID=UPI0023685DBA|nr:alpha-1,4-N-acetylglucosaminyltransferase-like isoform X2 [Plodia interpunctella]
MYFYDKMFILFIIFIFINLFLFTLLLFTKRVTKRLPRLQSTDNNIVENESAIYFNKISSGEQTTNSIGVILTREQSTNSIHFDKSSSIRQSMKSTHYPDIISRRKFANSIYFHETSTRGQLTVRQACCIESCARMNPKLEINVIFSLQFDPDYEIHKLLSQIGNIIFLSVNISSYVKGTPMEDFDTSILQKSEWPMHVTSDALRYLTLYKRGGIYLDLDVMSIKPLEVLGVNWAAMEDNYFVNSAAMAFAKDYVGRHVAKKAVRNFVEAFNVSDFSNNGPGVITRVLIELCGSYLTQRNCQGNCPYWHIRAKSHF